MKDAFGLSGIRHHTDLLIQFAQDIRSARQIEAEERVQESPVEGKDESKEGQDRQEESKDS